MISRQGKPPHAPNTTPLFEQSSFLFDLVTDAIIAKSLDGTITQWNAAAERMFGYSAKEIIGRPSTTLFPSDRLKEAEDILSRVKQGVSIQTFETVRLRKDGRPLDVAVTVSPLKNEMGKIIGSSKILRDITEFNLVKRQIEEQSTLLDKTRDAIIMSDIEGRVLSWNKGAERIYGWSRLEASGRFLGEFIYADPAKFREANSIALKRRRMVRRTSASHEGPGGSDRRDPLVAPAGRLRTPQVDHRRQHGCHRKA